MLRVFLLIPALFSLIFALSSCSSQLVVLKSNCSEMNWFEKGRQDGLQGQPSNNWIIHNKECENMRQAEIQNYMDGWNTGLSLFCTEKHGFITAKSGAAYQKICPAKYEPDFLKGYQQGLQIYLIEKETTQLSAQVENMTQELKKDSITPSAKAAIQREIATLNEKREGNLKTLEKYNTTYAR